MHNLHTFRLKQACPQLKEGRLLFFIGRIYPVSPECGNFLPYDYLEAGKDNKGMEELYTSFLDTLL
jgi:hypothetical protein